MAFSLCACIMKPEFVSIYVQPNSFAVRCRPPDSASQNGADVSEWVVSNLKREEGRERERKRIGFCYMYDLMLKLYSKRLGWPIVKKVDKQGEYQQLLFFIYFAVRRGFGGRYILKPKKQVKGGATPYS